MSRVLTQSNVQNFSYLDSRGTLPRHFRSDTTQGPRPTATHTPTRRLAPPPRHGRARARTLGPTWQQSRPPYNIQRVGVVYQSSPPGRRSWATASLLPPTGAAACRHTRFPRQQRGAHPQRSDQIKREFLKSREEHPSSPFPSKCYPEESCVSVPAGLGRRCGGGGAGASLAARGGARCSIESLLFSSLR